MRKLLLTAAACLLAACGDSTSPNDGIVVTGTLSVPAIQAGQSVSITLTILNRREQDVYVDVGGCDRPFDVINRFGQIVGPGAMEVCTLALVAPTRVPAGESVNVETAWAGDSSGIGPADEHIYLSPGSYLIRPRLRVVDEAGFSYGPAVTISIKP